MLNMFELECEHYHFFLNTLTSFLCFITSLHCAQVGAEDEVTGTPNFEKSHTGDDLSINLQPTDAYGFGQALNAARCSRNTLSCAELLESTAPEKLPLFLSNQLDGPTIGFIMQAMDVLLEKNPSLVYQHLNHLHTADRFSVRHKFQM